MQSVTLNTTLQTLVIFMVMSSKSASCFIEIKKLLWTYDLQDIEELLDSPVPRPLWKK